MDALHLCFGHKVVICGSWSVYNCVLRNRNGDHENQDPHRALFNHLFRVRKNDSVAVVINHYLEYSRRKIVDQDISVTKQTSYPNRDVKVPVDFSILLLFHERIGWWLHLWCWNKSETPPMQWNNMDFQQNLTKINFYRFKWNCAKKFFISLRILQLLRWKICTNMTVHDLVVIFAWVYCRFWLAKLSTPEANACRQAITQLRYCQIYSSGPFRNQNPHNSIVGLLTV